MRSGSEVSGLRRGRGEAARPPYLLLLPAALAGLFLLLPLAGLLARVSWRALPGELGSEDVRTAVGLSLETSLLALGVSLAIGVPLALVLARTALPGRRLLRALVLIPLVLPPVVGGIALQTAFGRDTVIGRVLNGGFGIVLPFSTAGAALAEAFVAFPFLVLIVEAGLRQRGTALEEVAATLGAGPWRRFWRVTLPLLAPSLIAGSALCWARALGEFGATITFAGSFPGTTQTLPLAAYAAFEGSGQVERAITLSFILLAISLAVLVGLRGRSPAAGL
jgi:molybdate transport system permease protein